MPSAWAAAVVSLELPWAGMAEAWLLRLLLWPPALTRAVVSGTTDRLATVPSAARVMLVAVRSVLSKPASLLSRDGRIVDAIGRCQVGFWS